MHGTLVQGLKNEHHLSTVNNKIYYIIYICVLNIKIKL